MELAEFVRDFAAAMRLADSRRTTARRGNRVFRPGIGPHSENQAVALTVAELRRERSSAYARFGSSSLTRRAATL